MLTLQATYTGPPSLGFVTAHVYTLEVANVGTGPDAMLMIRSTRPPHQSCPYGSWPRFLDFWANVTKLNPQT